MCGTLTLAQKQMVLIARAVQSACNFLILDEPTAPLSTIQKQKNCSGKSNTFVKQKILQLFLLHRIHEVLQICDSYTVMRNGEIIGYDTHYAQDNFKEIVDKCWDAHLKKNFPKQVCEIGEKLLKSIILQNERARSGYFMYVRKGEIVGLAGLVGEEKQNCVNNFRSL